ncbi:Undecaprenyl-phosphate 4-deoxy-4-formamido-L-arabinose transferase [Pseudobythopirellula maris]|uniref:Undecaprenyl-phosphate 4-deoxy-4-formamido-L-arabinose transferase n=1 Tax=Pseudobythopirellula maris TaxID=2527991 RepID=A0A5C5ZNC4_9BACT|nr:glycosyltransferase family 2 protein [Pseudobythopirellula maris]TWT88992.1 Undecaprenyl-phosphate 4-deoxy-4-formamido-L-arabinose transferase [Pseudobythopirellula maris]
MHVSVVVPIYNERDNVEPLCDALRNSLGPSAHDYELILVDDGSTDGTRERLRGLAAEREEVRLVELRRNYGQTAAMSAGLEFACRPGLPEGAVVTIDGDLQNDPADIPLVVDKLAEGYGMVHGWRRNRQDKWLSRKLPSLLANRLISWSTGFKCRDLGCTLKAIRRDIAADLRLYGEMHRFIPIMVHWHGARCTEIPTHHHPRLHGESKYGIGRTFGVLMDLVTIVYLTRFSQNPMRLFGGLGAVATLLGGAMGVVSLAMKLFGGADLTGNPLLYAGCFAGLAGLQLLLMGMIAEMASRTLYESQGSRPYAIESTAGFGAQEPLPGRAAA